MAAGHHNPDKVYHGKPCRFGHGTLRYTKRRDCVECNKVKQLVRTRLNKDAINAARRERWANDPEYREKRRAKNLSNQRAASEATNAARRERRRSDPAYREHERAKSRARYAKNGHSEAAKAYFRKWRYGLSDEDYRALLERQGGACAICKETNDLVVDHCHKTEKVRGLLCRPCNTGIGALRESENVFAAALQYLRGHK